MKTTKLIAFYLPQYHPIPENDEWWQPGFTEWTNVVKAKPLFKGHIQPKIPRDLGFYDLRVPETREKQAELAKKAGIYGFCYWHYWFGNGKRLLERPFDEVVASGKPDFPFCLGWANHTWANKTWTPGKDDKILIEQQYPGKQDYIDHFLTMLPAFKDNRYITIEGKLVFLIWDSLGIPDVKDFFNTWNELALQHELPGFYYIGFCRDIKHIEELKEIGYDSVCVDLLLKCKKEIPWKSELKWKLYNHLNHPIPRQIEWNAYHKACVDFFKNNNDGIIPCIMPNWDHSPRSKNRGEILMNSSPENFAHLLKDIIEIKEHSKDPDNVVFIKSWNEWGEGNYLEPDQQYGLGYINALEMFKENYE